VKGAFINGDVVRIFSPKNQVFALALTNYSAEEIEKIKGKKTSEISAVLGSLPYGEVVHRDNMVIVNKE
jgi:glutamate 5-kinase